MLYLNIYWSNAQKIKFIIKGFFGKCDQNTYNTLKRSTPIKKMIPYGDWKFSNF